MKVVLDLERDAIAVFDIGRQLPSLVQRLV